MQVSRKTKSRKRVRLFVAVAVIVVVTVIGAGMATAHTSPQRLAYSTNADHSDAKAFRHFVPAADIYPFVRNVSRVVDTKFYLDGNEVSVEPLTSASFADGKRHVLTAVVTKQRRNGDGVREFTLRAVFKVRANSNVPSSTTTTTDPSGTTTTIPTTTTSSTSTTSTTIGQSTTTTVVSPPNTGDKRCAAYPAFPDAECTGPVGSLPLYTGSDEIRVDGTVIENVEIRTSGLYVPASNVTFRNVKVVYTGALDATFTIFNLNYNNGTTFENCEIDGQGKVARAITGSGGVTVRNCEIHGVGNAIETDTPLFVEDNYIHDIKTADGTDWHADGIQTPSGADNVTVRHNTIILTGGETGAINIMGETSDPATNVLIENNLFAGGGYTMYAGPGQNYRVLNNHFSTQVFPDVGGYGIWYWNAGEDGDVVRSGNVIHETGQPANN